MSLVEHCRLGLHNNKQKTVPNKVKENPCRISTAGIPKWLSHVTQREKEK